MKETKGRLRPIHRRLPNLAIGDPGGPKSNGWSLKKRPLGKRETSTNPSLFEVPHLSFWGCSIIYVPYISSTKQCFLLGGSSDDSYKQLSRLVCRKPSASHIRHPSSLGSLIICQIGRPVAKSRRFQLVLECLVNWCLHPPSMQAKSEEVVSKMAKT